jgi:hypothetical protein
MEKTRLFVSSEMREKEPAEKSKQSKTKLWTVKL